MTKITKQNLRIRARRLSNKLSVKRMKLTVCDECTSSSEEDQWPILPSTTSGSSDELSPIEEEDKLSDSVASLSESTSVSKYYSSLLESSITTVSSMSDDESSYKPLHEDNATACNNEVCHASDVYFPESNGQTEQTRSAERRNETTVVNIGFEPLLRQTTSQHSAPPTLQQSMSDSPSYITISSGVCEFNDIYRSKNFTFLMMNFALIASNGNQLKYLMNSQESLRFFYISLGLIIASCVFQFIAKTFSFVSYCFSLNTEAGIKRVKCLNTFIVLFAFLTTVANLGLTAVLLLECYDIIPI